MIHVKKKKQIVKIRFDFLFDWKRWVKRVLWVLLYSMKTPINMSCIPTKLDHNEMNLRIFAKTIRFNMCEVLMMVTTYKLNKSHV